MPSRTRTAVVTDVARAAPWLPLVCFLSGAAGLIFETAWFHRSGLVFGSSVWSTSLVLSSFFLVRGKIQLLVASGREASLAELTAVAALLGEWRAAMRSANH